MTSAEFEKQLSLWSEAPAWGDLVSQACLGENFDEATWGGVAAELRHISAGYAQLGLSPESSSLSPDVAFPVDELPWPGIDGLILPARIVLAGLSVAAL
jgi:hypothetical protein